AVLEGAGASEAPSDERADRRGRGGIRLLLGPELMERADRELGRRVPSAELALLPSKSSERERGPERETRGLDPRLERQSHRSDAAIAPAELSRGIASDAFDLVDEKGIEHALDEIVDARFPRL